MEEVHETEPFLVFLTPCICKTGAVFLTMISQELGKASNWLTLIISSIQTEMGNDIFGISSLPLKFTIFISLPFELNIGGSSFDFFCLLDPNYRRKCLRDNNKKTTTLGLQVQIEQIEWLAWSDTLIYWGTNLSALITFLLCFPLMINKNYYVVRNAGWVCSKSTWKLAHF